MNIFLPLRLISLLVALQLASFSVSAEQLVIIVHASNQQSIDLEDIARIYLGKHHQFPNGDIAIPLDLPTDDPLYRAFSQTILKKSPSQLRAYWAKRIFTGRGKPPKSVLNREKSKNLVSEDRNYISYTDAKNADQSVHRIISINIE